MSPFSWATSSAEAICAAIRAARAGSSWPVAPDQRAELRSVDPSRGDVHGAALLPGLVQRDDVGVVERGQRPGLAAQSLTDHRVARHLGVHKLERDGPVQAQLAGSVEHADTAGAHNALDLIAGDDGPGREQGAYWSRSEIRPSEERPFDHADPLLVPGQPLDAELREQHRQMAPHDTHGQEELLGDLLIAGRAATAVAPLSGRHNATRTRFAWWTGPPGRHLRLRAAAAAPPPAAGGRSPWWRRSAPRRHRPGDAGPPGARR